MDTLAMPRPPSSVLTKDNPAVVAHVITTLGRDLRAQSGTSLFVDALDEVGKRMTDAYGSLPEGTTIPHAIWAQLYDETLLVGMMGYERADDVLALISSRMRMS